MRGMSTLAASAVLLLKPTAEALSVPENEYVGCFKDSRKDRVMSNILVDDKQMSAAFCRNHCEGKGALFYGTQVCGCTRWILEQQAYRPAVCVLHFPLVVGPMNDGRCREKKFRLLSSCAPTILTCQFYCAPVKLVAA